jgi:hypothetical protein
MRPHLLALTAAASVAAAGITASTASAADVELGGDQTMLKLKPSTARALTSLGVRVAPISPATNSSSGLTFPVTGGTVDTAHLSGTVEHSGGLRFRAGGVTVALRNFEVRLGKRSSLSALVGRTRVPIIALSLKGAKVAQDGATLQVSGVKASLNATGARALNRAFGVRAFRKGLELGTVRSELTPSQVVQLTGGQTDLAIDPATADALVGAGITPTPAAPATASGLTFSFPITPGSEASADLALGSIRHTGGITLTRGSTAVTLSDFDIRLDATPSLLAKPNGGAPAEIIDLDLSNPQVASGTGTLTVGGVGVKLSTTGADAINAAFGLNLPAGTPLGVATVRATV